ncbi:ZZ-type zinc finger-containing protein 3 [Cimex lectularius]|uniref:ZZ-type zinc finger-containing protein 3 n=1 Tax=Cimex lectularius TaxID=79782 RepID=A0A8I6RV97_CIMLE|nr:ZZ-type zinc finger-containing protein 3 [Cimex lectularius]
MAETSVKFLNDLFKQDHVDGEEDFYFETDFLALKGNRDYLKLVKALAILDAQRIKVAQDIDKLEELKRRVDIDPEGVKHEILETKPDYLHRLNIAKVPEIDWTKYKTDFTGKLAQKTRRSKQLNTSPESSIKQESIKQEDDKTIRVRGRVYNEKKPETFNQLWTVEEQLRLEQLLIEFPPERVENRRWKKIAQALGNRTTKQVCSRVQKYFQKLQKAGITVPSRSTSRSSKPAHVNKRHKHLLYKRTTFFPGLALGEMESESDEDTCLSNESDEVNLAYWKSVLEKIVEEKKNYKEGDEMVQHFGYKCKLCEECPILGTRWTCSSCPEFHTCSDCLAAIVDKEPPIHSLSHKFNPIYEFINPYYSSKALGSDNYLDPNFETHTQSC